MYAQGNVDDSTAALQILNRCHRLPALFEMFLARGHLAGGLAAIEGEAYPDGFFQNNVRTPVGNFASVRVFNHSAHPGQSAKTLGLRLTIASFL